jgi:hypothetical protein
MLKISPSNPKIKKSGACLEAKNALFPLNDGVS